MLQTRGINDLLAAEKKAQELIDAARKRKNKRIKDAQNEAKSDVDQFKGERDGRFKAIEQEVRCIWSASDRFNFSLSLSLFRIATG